MHDDARSKVLTPRGISRHAHGYRVSQHQFISPFKLQQSELLAGTSEDLEGAIIIIVVVAGIATISSPLPCLMA